MRYLLVVLFAVGCGGRVESESESGGSNHALNPCGAPAFTGDQCHYERLNDGSGPDDRRTICVVGEDQWIQYESGEQWHIVQGDGGDPVRCHAAADGTILWPVRDR